MDIAVFIFALFLLIKRKIAGVLFFVVFLSTNFLGAVNSINNFPFKHNVADLGLILYIIFFMYLLDKNNFTFHKSNYSKYVGYFYFFLSFSIIVDFFYNGIDFISIIKTSRHWLFLSCVWVFYYIPVKSLKKLVNYLFIATLIISLLMLLQYYTGIQLVGKKGLIETSASGNLVKRGAIPSTYVSFFLLLLLTNYFNFKQKNKYLFIVIFASVLITSMIRSLNIAIIIGIFFVYFFKRKIKTKNILSSLIIIIGLFVTIYVNPSTNERFKEGFKEIQNFSFNNKDVEGNFSFRILHVEERLNYITKKWQYIFFGIGNVTEENFLSTFIYGLQDDYGRTNQLNTADIAWSVLFIRLGLLVTFIYLLFYIKLMNNYYHFKDNYPLALVTFVYLLINLTLISFASNIISNGQFFLFPILLYYLIYKENELKNKNIRNYVVVQKRKVFKRVFQGG